ncbi:MAG: radical SAM protein [Candidatus Krumholzibacteriota bacterium]|nr:radical SAM protein [Candidatus Krumholzibacteriota bacterium]
MERSNSIENDRCEVSLNLPALNRKFDKSAIKERYLESLPSVPKRARPVYVGYPSTYRIGMSNLGLHFIYRSLASRGSMRVERFFTDTAPLTFETGAGISDAFALLFSVSYEEDYLDLIRILVTAGVEPLRSRREGGPLIIAGGPATSANPMPLSEIVDAAALGEGEGIIGEIAEILESADNDDRNSVVDRLANIEGMYVPSRPGKIPVIRHGSRGSVFPHSIILSSDTVFPDTLLIETGRGCPGSCGFCLARSLYRPYRPASFEAIARLLEKTSGKVDKLGLVSTAVISHPRFNDIMGLIRKYGLSVGFSSFKAEDIDAEKASMISEAGVRSVSLAPESGSEKVRFRLGKKVPDEIYIDAVKELVKNGIVNINLYLLTGSPGEDGKARDDTRTFLKRVREVSGKGRVSVHTNVLIPKPWTPLQFYPVPAAGELKGNIEAISKICRDTGISFAAKSIRSSLRQAILSIGGKEAGNALIAYSGGSISWKKAFRENGIDPDEVHEERGIGRPLPWDRITGPCGKDSLLSRYKKMVDLKFP